MPDVVALLLAHYDPKYGVVNVRPVVDALVADSRKPFDELEMAFHTAEPQWQRPILEGMRTLAADGRCSREQAKKLLDATVSVAADVGVDEHFHTINAVAISSDAAEALPEYAARLLGGPRKDLDRRLALYIVAMLLDRGTASVPDSLWDALQAASRTETSPLKTQFAEILRRRGDLPR